MDDIRYFVEEDIINVHCLIVLLRWGFYCYYYLSPQYMKDYMVEAATTGNWKAIELLIALNPGCLQESCIVSDEIPDEHELFTAKLMEACRQPQPLTVLCRSKIFQQLGYNPVVKVEKLPLPSGPKDFVKFKDILNM